MYPYIYIHIHIFRANVFIYLYTHIQSKYSNLEKEEKHSKHRRDLTQNTLKSLQDELEKISYLMEGVKQKSLQK
jgi:hypothetical protein